MTDFDASAHISETLDRAQKCWDATVGVGSVDDPPSDRVHIAWFIHHVTTAVLLEHIRRLDRHLADHLVDWLLVEDSIFGDGLAGELLYQWRQQIAVGQPMEPISEYDTAEPDWRRIAVQLHRFNGAFHGLTTPERDALEAEIRERDEADRDVGHDRTTDAASFHEESHDG